MAGLEDVRGEEEFGIFPSTQKPTVLVVDPDPEWQIALAEGLEGEFCVLTASSFEVATTILDDVEIDAIVTEAVLNGVTGAELHAHVQRTFPELAAAIVFVTAGGFDSALARFFAATPSRVLYKAFDGAPLREAVRDATRGGDASGLAAVRALPQNVLAS